MAATMQMVTQKSYSCTQQKLQKMKQAVFIKAILCIDESTSVGKETMIGLSQKVRVTAPMLNRLMKEKTVK